MTDPIDVSYSFQIGAPTPPPAPAPSAGASLPLYAYAQCEQIMLNESTVVIVNTRSGGKLAVTRDVANALTYCLHYQTLPEHAAMLCAAVPMLRGQQADVLQILESARAAGILLAAADTARRIGTAPAPTPLAPTRVFIITCDRPAAVERLLDSLLEAGELSRHERLVLIDDSRHEDNARRNRELLGAFNRNSAKPMQYFGAQAAGDLLARLLAALPEQADALRFLLDRARWAGQPTYGLARNLCLLLSVGCRAVILDDDILCRAVHAPQGTAGMGFRHEEAREAWFYGSRAALLRATRTGAFNPLSRHADAVGLSLAATLAAQVGGPLPPAMLARCHGTMLGVLDGSSPVLVTQCGSAGDPGTVGAKWVTRLGSTSVQRLLAQGGDPAVLPSCRPCWLGYTRPTIALRGDMSQMTGLDNRQLLPPYLPVLRGEDALFASMTARLHPHSAVLNFDWAILHLPLDERAGTEYDEPFTTRAHLGVLTSYLLDRVDTRGGGTPAARLAALAQELRQLAQWPADSLLPQLGLELARGYASSVALLEGQLADAVSGRHPAWRSFLERQLAQARAALLAPVALADSPPEWLAPVQRAALDFAQALAAWPRIREAAAAVAVKLLDAAWEQP